MIKGETQTDENGEKARIPADPQQEPFYTNHYNIESKESLIERTRDTEERRRFAKPAPNSTSTKPLALAMMANAHAVLAAGYPSSCTKEEPNN